MSPLETKLNGRGGKRRMLLKEPSRRISTMRAARRLLPLLHFTITEIERGKPVVEVDFELSSEADHMEDI